jgi:hypothetical protein
MSYNDTMCRSLLTWQPPVSPADHLPPITAATSVSCRPFTTHHSNHQCLVQTIYLPSQQSSVSPACYLPCCHGSYHYVLQMIYIIQWHPPVSAADPLTHATADIGVCPFMLLCIFTPPSCIYGLCTNSEGEHSLWIVGNTILAKATLVSSCDNL